MLVNFMDLKTDNVFLRREYSDVSPILLMVDARAPVDIFFDPEGDERVSGRFHHYEYTIEMNDGEIKESLEVIIASDEYTFKRHKC